MTFRVLAARGTDAEAWYGALRRFPASLRDLHYLPEYGTIYQAVYGFEPLLAVLTCGQHSVVQAFVRRSLDTLPFLAECGLTGFADVATPYGFGGPLVSHPDAPDASRLLLEFDAHYRAWCRHQGVATEFVCLHPLLGNHRQIEAAATTTIAAAKQVVVIDLTAPDADLWAGISRGTRSSIQRARRSGIEVQQVAPDAAALAEFQRLYIETMHRRRAQPRWFFPESYFPACVSHLGAEHTALFFARRDGELAAAYLLLFDHQSAYYHFGGADVRWLQLRPNNLLMYETIRWAKARGLESYHLGGGVTSDENDSLLRFKSSFGGSQATLYTYGRILNEAVYERLCGLKAQYERRTGAAIADCGFFPMYRR
jgi:hypothetical protein